MHSRPTGLLVVASLLLTGALLSSARSAVNEDGTVIVSTLSGPIRGISTSVEVTSSSGTDYVQKVNIFRGVPYAKQQRFKPPVTPPDSWISVRDATAFGPSCFQDLTDDIMPGTLSENCLYLNVYAPVTDAMTPLPVMVWIHGGSFRHGSSTLYDGRMLAAVGNVSVVTINYRLGAFGFLTTNDTSTGLQGNLGLQDQQAAIKWVNRNIASFGGDPDSITIFGESAGAASVNMHLISPNINPYFHRAIAESGSMFAGWAVQEQADMAPAATMLAQDLGCAEGDSIDVACLLNAPADSIVDAQTNIYEQYAESKQQLPFTPTIDGNVIPSDPLSALQEGDLPPVDILIGVNKDEWSYFALDKVDEGDDMPSIPQEEFNSLADYFVKLGYWGFPAVGSSCVPDTVKYAYTDWTDPYSGSQRLQQAVEMGSDFNFVCPLQMQADYTSNETNLYMYQFSHYCGIFPPWAGVPHTAEVYFVFGLPFLLSSYPLHNDSQLNYTFSDDDRKVSMTMMALWSAFATTGDPNDGLGHVTNLTDWPTYDDSTHNYLDINLVSTVRNFLHNEKCQLLNYFARQLDNDCLGRPPITPTPTSPPTPAPITNHTKKPTPPPTPSPITNHTTCPTVAPTSPSPTPNRNLYLYTIIALAVCLVLAIGLIIYLLWYKQSTNDPEMPINSDPAKRKLMS